MMNRRERLIELQERRQELAKLREENRDNVPFQIGRAIAYVVIIGVPLVGLAWLVGAI